MAESQFPWSTIQKKAKKPLDNLQRTMEKAVSNFGKYPKDPFQRREFKNRVQEAAVSWARKFIDIYDKVLADTGSVGSDSTARLAWHSELSNLLEPLIMRQVEAAFAFGADDVAWLKFGELIRTDEVDAAQAKVRAISQIRADLLKLFARCQPGIVTSHSQVSSQVESTTATSLEVVSQPTLKRIPPRRRVKICDLSKYLDCANLTDKQYQCMSLKFEYRLSEAEIARELERHRKTINQHITAGQSKMRTSGQYEGVRKRLAQNNPETE